MGLFDSLSQNTTVQSSGLTPEKMRCEINNIQKNPAEYLSKRGLQIPQGMTDPKEITIHLLRSGQVGNTKLQQVMRLLGAR